MLQSESVYLIFSINESGGLQGFAKLLSVTNESSTGKFIDPKNYCYNKKTMNIKWLCFNYLSFRFTSKLHNIYNDNKPVFIARDGQPINFETGFKLCNMILSKGQNWLDNPKIFNEYKNSANTNKFPNITNKNPLEQA